MRVFFLDDATRMNPNLNRAQGIRGRSIGRPWGIIDGLHLVEIARAVRVLEQEAALPASTVAGAKRWFADLCSWMITSDHGRQEASAKNNHAVAYFVQLAAFADLTRDHSSDVLVEQGILELGAAARRRTGPCRGPLCQASALSPGLRLLGFQGRTGLERRRSIQHHPAAGAVDQRPSGVACPGYRMSRHLVIAVLAIACGGGGGLRAQLILPAPAAAAAPAVAPVQPNPFAPLPENAIIGPGGPTLPGPPPVPRNAVVIPPLDAELVWTKMVDVADDFFKVQAEQRVVFSNGVPTEGRIETFPQTGATILEPWRGDSVGWDQRWESTLQSIRRIASMRLTPDAGGWRIEVVVNKELENMPRPMRATTGGASFRNDDSLYRYGTPLPTLGQQVGDQPRPVASPTPNLGWIPLGRDPLLERKMLAGVLAKLGVPPQPQVEPYYQPPDATSGGPALGQPAAPSMPQGPVYGAPIPPEQLPPGAAIAPGPPVPIESLPIPK